MKKVAFYIRVSTEEQVINGYGLDIQKEALSRYAKIHGYSIDENHIYSDEGKSGAEKKDRPALRKLLQSAKNKEFDIVLVWKVDRFFRKVLYLLEGVETLENMGVGFISITQPFDTTQPFGKMMLQMMGVIAELERDLIRERTSNGILASMKDGKWGRGNTPFGYRRNKEGFLQIQEDEADVIKTIFGMVYKDGFNVNQVCTKLMSMNVATSGTRGGIGEGRKKNIKHKNLWQASTVHKILRNIIYKGVLVQNKFTADKLTKKRIEKPESEWIVGKSPKIVSEKDFEKTRLTLEKNLKFSRKNTKKGEVYMLAKLIECGVTGYKYIGYKSTKGTKNYRLSVNKTKISNFEKIGSRGISALKIEGVVWEKIKSVLQNPHILEKELIKMSKSGKNEEKEIRRKMKILDENLKTISDNTSGLLKLVNGLDEDSIGMIQSEIKKNHTNTEEIRKEKLILEKELLGKDDIKEKVDNFMSVSKIVNENLDNLDYSTKAEICKLLLEKVVFDGTNVSIHLLVPISPKNKVKLKVDVVKDFFNDKKDFLGTKLKEFEKDIESSITTVTNLRTYYYH